MQIGVIGLGRMGQIVADRLATAGHDILATDVDPDARASAAVETVPDVPALVESLERPRVLWLMVPAGDAVEETLETLAGSLTEEDVVVDGGNSHYEESIRRASACPADYLDCGTSGGPAAADQGFSLMVGGPASAYERLEPAFDAVATGPDGHAHLGPAGAGHYVKMVHNGIEYALMQSYGEGFELLANGRYDLDLADVADVWTNGSVIRSWLLELCGEAFREEGSDLGTVADRVEGGSTGTWTVEEALEQEVPVPLIYTALAERFESRADERFSRRLAARLRYGFGRHEIPRN